MPNNNLRNLARRRAVYTGESHSRALKALHALPSARVAIPVANRAQALLEMEVLEEIGRFGISDSAGWVPGEEPLGIQWMTPHTDRLDIGVRMRFLPSLLFRLLPLFTDQHGEPVGVCGLRFRILPDAVELYRLGLPGSIRVCDVTAGQWWQAVNTTVADMRDNDLGIDTAIWHHYPDCLAPAEEEHARTYCPGYCPELPKQFDDMAAVASDFLRHHQVLAAGEAINGLRLWMDTRLKVEWADGPLHPEVVARLTQAGVGMSAVFDKSFGGCDTECGGTARLRAGNGTRIELRREKLAWSRRRADHAHERLTRRLHRLKHHEGTTRLVEPPPPQSSGSHHHRDASPSSAGEPVKSLLLAERLAHSTAFMKAPTDNRTSVVRLAKAWNAFSTIGFVCAALTDFAVPARDNYTVALDFACHAIRILDREIGAAVLKQHGRTDDNPPGRQQLEPAFQAAQLELFTSTEADIERIASAIITLSADLGDLLTSIADDDRTQSSHQKIAQAITPYAREIWTHFDGDGGGW